MKNYKKILLVSVFGVLLLVGASKAKTVFNWEAVEKWTGYFLAQRVEVPAAGQSVGQEPGQIGIAGDTYQSSKNYSIITTNSGTRVIGSVPCSTWAIKSVRVFLVPSSTAATATTTIAMGVATSSANTFFSTTISSGDVFATSTNNYVVSTTPNGAGITCASGSYINAVLGATNTTTNGVLSVDYLLYQ